MDITINKNPAFMVIDNFYSEEELSLILSELKFLSSGDKLVGQDTDAAKEEDGTSFKSNTGVWLGNVYSDLGFSDIHNINRRVFMDFIPNVKTGEWFFENIKLSRDYTLLSYYEEGDYYKSHKDESLITVVTWLFEEPKKFQGGDIVFTNFDTKIEVKHGRTVIFPSFLDHEVTEINMINDKDYGQQKGRYSMIQFALSDKETNRRQ